MPLAPGLLSDIDVAGLEELTIDESIRVHAPSGVIALDGERVLRFAPDDAVTVALRGDGPRAIDVARTMRIAATSGVLDELAPTTLTTPSTDDSTTRPDPTKHKQGDQLMSQTKRLDFYKGMVRIRQYEARIMQEYPRGQVTSVGYRRRIDSWRDAPVRWSGTGSGGCVCALEKGDAITAPHRPHHFALAHGVDMNKMTAEIYGRTTGLSHGKGGHMHLFDPDNHFSCSRSLRRVCRLRVVRRSRSSARASTTLPLP